MKSWTLGALLGLGLMSCPGSLRACLWDRDTIRIEALAHLEVVQTAAGWFDRNPPLYYQMRLDRVSKLLEATPEALDLYDDAAVACERLGRQDDAIAWMARKKTKLGDNLQCEQGYRYLSNLGTFYLHRWASNKDHGHQREDLREAIRLITEALKVNPDAHFGRERVQLALMRWLLEGYENPGDHGFENLSNYVDPDHRDHLDYTKGLCGLVQMGFAWESLDVFFWLAKEAEQNRNALLSVFVRERIDELAASGHTPLFPWDLSNAVTMGPGELPLMQLLQVGYHIEPDERVKAVRYFTLYRAEADARDRQRTEFMTARLQKGMHPDTHPDFWTGWEEPSMPLPPADPFLRTYFGPHWRRNIGVAVFAVVCGLLIAFVIRLVHKLQRPV